jgi:post-segregation antitoxin (ccd killing protein)
MHTIVCATLVCMSVDRLSVTVPGELGQAIREAAAEAGISVSSWMSEAATSRLRHHRLGVALDAWQAENGAFTEAELDAARAMLAGGEPARRAS